MRPRITVSYQDCYGGITEVSWENDAINREDILEWFQTTGIVGLGFVQKQEEKSRGI